MKRKSKMSLDDVLSSIPTKGMEEWRKEQAQYNENVETKLLPLSSLKEEREEDCEISESKEFFEMDDHCTLLNSLNQDDGTFVNDVDPESNPIMPSLENNFGQESEGDHLSPTDNNLKNEMPFGLEPVANQRSNGRLDYFISKRKAERKLELGSISVKISFELKIKLDELRMDLNKGLRLSGQNHRAFALKEILEILYDEHIKTI